MESIECPWIRSKTEFHWGCLDSRPVPVWVRPPPYVIVNRWPLTMRTPSVPVASGDTTLTLKFRGIEAEALELMVSSGMFNSKSEAIRAALVHYSVETGLMDRLKLWRRLMRHPPRKASIKQLWADIRRAEGKA